MNKQLSPRFPTPFAAFAEQRRLDCYIEDEGLVAAYASSDIQILPYQIAAARFALRSANLKGCILCDEGSLGKTYEALLVVSQRWYEGKERILIVLPQNLKSQWQEKLTKEFTLPITDWSEYTQETKGPWLMTYDEVIKNEEKVSQIVWDLAVFDEADFLFKPDNKSVATIKKAVGNAFKLLLTPTPITLSIMDIYGLIHFIDETLLPDAESFYKRYFRNLENYPELSSWVSKFAFRTLKRQVEPYVNFTKRLPVVLNYTPQDDEKKLYDLTEKYLALDNKTAYPQMDNYQLALQFYRTLSSSPQAFANMLSAPIERASSDERIILQTMQKMALEIPVSAKMDALLKALKTTFTHLKSRKEVQKAIIFVDNLTTLSVLSELLKEHYSVIKHTDDNALNIFREGKNIQILITNDATAKGLDIEYCPVVVNYDLLYNAVEMEQRICRCHRQGQQSDVLVINLLSQENMSDVRILELINKRTLQFQGIFGMSDDIVGHFDETLEAVLQKRRTLPDIQRDFAQNTTFTKDVAEKVQVSPQYIQEQADFVNRDLWEVVKFYFEKHHPQYIIDDINQTLTLPDDCEQPHMFYYWNGTRNTPYTGKRQYGMAKDFKPASGRITLTSILAKGIFSEIECATEGEINLEINIEPCQISMYNVELRRKGKFLKSYDVLTGKTEDGKILTQEECVKILSQPIKSVENKDRERSYWLANSSFSDRLPLALEDELKNNYIKQQENCFNADIDIIKMRSSRQKAVLEQTLEALRQETSKIKESIGSAKDRIEELKIQKQINEMEKQLRKKEEGLFFEQMRIEATAEDEIEKLCGTDGISVVISPIFKVQFQKTPIMDETQDKCFF